MDLEEKNNLNNLNEARKVPKFSKFKYYITQSKNSKIEKKGLVRHEFNNKDVKIIYKGL